MNTVLILVFGTAGGCFIGLALAKRSRERTEYFRCLLELCAQIESGISFREEKLEDILSGVEVRSESLKKNIADYLTFVRGGELKIENRLLSEKEKAEIKDFFSRLGSFDVETQLSELRRNRDKFAMRLDLATRKSDKSASYIKLGSLFGLLVGILLI